MALAQSQNDEAAQSSTAVPEFGIPHTPLRPRVAVQIPGKYMLENKREYSCRTSAISAAEVAVEAEHSPRLEEHVVHSAQVASALLDKLILQAPFRVRGIQVDGGSEFKSVFEDECKRRGLDLFVLPPKRPDLNGCVERAQSTWRYEFYATWDLPHRIDKLQTFVDAFAHRFNHSRPDQALGDLTPAEYLKTLSCGHPNASHMN